MIELYFIQVFTQSHLNCFESRQNYSAAAKTLTGVVVIPKVKAE